MSDLETLLTADQKRHLDLAFTGSWWVRALSFVPLGLGVIAALVFLWATWGAVDGDPRWMRGLQGLFAVSIAVDMAGQLGRAALIRRLHELGASRLGEPGLQPSPRVAILLTVQQQKALARAFDNDLKRLVGRKDLLVVVGLLALLAVATLVSSLGGAIPYLFVGTVLAIFLALAMNLVMRLRQNELIRRLVRILESVRPQEPFAPRS